MGNCALVKDVAGQAIPARLHRKEAHRRRHHDPGFLRDDADRPVGRRQLDEPIEDRSDGGLGGCEVLGDIDNHA